MSRAEGLAKKKVRVTGLGRGTMMVAVVVVLARRLVLLDHFDRRAVELPGVFVRTAKFPLVLGCGWKFLGLFRM